MFLVHYPVYILNHNNGVVDHYADGQDETQQCHKVEREAEQQHHTESAYQRNRHCNQWDQCGAPALQRQVDYQYDERKSFKKSSVDMVDRGCYISSGIEWH